MECMHGKSENPITLFPLLRGEIESKPLFITDLNKVGTYGEVLERLNLIKKPHDLY